MPEVVSFGLAAEAQTDILLAAFLGPTSSFQEAPARRRQREGAHHVLPGGVRVFAARRLVHVASRRFDANERQGRSGDVGRVGDDRGVALRGGEGAGPVAGCRRDERATTRRLASAPGRRVGRRPLLRFRPQDGGGGCFRPEKELLPMGAAGEERRPQASSRAGGSWSPAPPRGVGARPTWNLPMLAAPARY